MTYFLYSYFKINFVLCSSSSFSLLYDIPHAIPQNAIEKCTLLFTVCGHLDDFQFPLVQTMRDEHSCTCLLMHMCLSFFLGCIPRSGAAVDKFVLFFLLCWKKYTKKLELQCVCVCYNSQKP